MLSRAANNSKLKRNFFHCLPRSPSKPKYSLNHDLLVNLLQSCKYLKTLLQIHAQLIVRGLSFHISTSTHLINLYSSFQRCDYSRSIFDFTPNPAVILWNSMIRAYTRAEQNREALEVYHLMQKKLVKPDKYTFTFVLKACTGIPDLEEGRLIHREIVNQKLEVDVFIGTGLVDMYSKMNDLDNAREVFDKMPTKDIVAWNAMISGLAQNVEPKEAIYFFKYMQVVGLEPNSVSLLNLFPAVCRLRDVKTCISIHGYIWRRNFPVAVLNGLIDMYAKCGYSDIARMVFDQMMNRDDVTWGTMMSGYAYNGDFYEVLELFDCMKCKILKMNKVSAVSAILAASEIRDLEKGLEIHDYAIKQSIDSDVMVATSLMTMYAKCGELKRVYEMFSGIQGRDLVAWSAVIAAFAQSGYSEEALSVFREMQNENMKPNVVTLVSVLPACAEISFVKLGKSLHCYAFKDGIDLDISLGTALVSMYAKCGMFGSALAVFSRMPLKEVVTWNALINGYAQFGDPYHAIKMFSELRLSSLHPDSGTVVGVLPACALLGDVNLGSQVHVEIMKYGFESDSHVKNSLIDMYAKCGSLSSAEFLFNQNEFVKDEVSWNVIIAGYLQNGRAKDAISSFNCMKSEGLLPNLATIVSILPAASYLAALKEGMAIHAYISVRGFSSYTLIGNALIDMYAKCGSINHSKLVYDGIKSYNLVTENAMLTAYAMNGYGEEGIVFFRRLLDEGFRPDEVTFLSVLSSCVHAGSVEIGKECYKLMGHYGVTPTLKHYTCLVDLISRAGKLDEALNVIRNMPMETDVVIWGALLGGCIIHGNVDLGELAANKLIELEPYNTGNHVMLANLYASAGRWEDFARTRQAISDKQLHKSPGCSWIEDRDEIHVFVASDRSHKRANDIYTILDNLTYEMRLEQD